MTTWFIPGIQEWLSTKKKKKKNPVDLSEDREKSLDKIQSVCFRS